MVLTDTELVDMIFREESDPDLRNELLRVAANDPLVRLMPSHSVLSYLKSSMDTEVVPAPAPQIPLSPELKEAFDVLRQDLDCISSAGKASTTVQASRISEGKLEDICARLRVRFWWDPPGFPVKVLYDISQDHIDSNSREWSTLLHKSRMEAEERVKYAALLEQHVLERCGEAPLHVTDARGMTLNLQPSGIPKLAGQQDEVIVLHRWVNEPAHGALAGIAVNKHLTERALRQAKVEFLISACTTYYPFIQFLTDFTSGGVAMFVAPQTAGTRVLISCSVLRGMDDFWSFFDQCLQSVPPHLGASADRLFVEELASPSRIALGAPDGEDAVYDAHAALRSLAGLLNAVGDVANLDDLEGFPELSSCMSELTCMCE